MISFKHTILVFIFTAPTLLLSQVNLGIKASANYDYHGFSSDSLDLSFENTTSYSGGAFLRVKIKKISLQAEGLFIGRKGTVSVNDVEKSINFYSFDLPLLIGYKLIDLKVIKLRLNAGVIPSFHIKSFGDLEDANFEDSFYSLAGGISVDIPLFIFDIRYQGAIGDYYALKNIDSSTTLTSSLVTLSVAWKIL